MNPWHTLGSMAWTLDERDARTRQKSWLMTTLHRNRDSTIGRAYGFDNIQGYDDYRARVPLTDYASLESWILQLANGEQDVLFRGPCIAFERTSGSTAGPKTIPFSAENIKDISLAVLPWLGQIARQLGPKAGKAYWAISPATRAPEFTPGGIPIGLPDAAYLGEAALTPFAQTSAMPSWVGSIPDVDSWRLATLYHMLRAQDLCLISVWSPTFAQMLIDSLTKDEHVLLEILRDGTRLSGHILDPDREAARRLLAYRDSGDSRSLWPHMQLVSCWVDATSGPYARRLMEHFPQARLQAKGLMSTEGVVTVPDEHDRPVLAIDSGFFEFLASNGDLVFAWELEAGKEYEVIMTTAGGLYRYQTGDNVRCINTMNGVSGDLPSFEFIGRGNTVGDLAGEKLTEAFVSDCLEGVPGFRVLVPIGGVHPRYQLILDTNDEVNTNAVLRQVEAALHQSPQYAYARRIGQLHALELRCSPGTFNRYVHHRLNKGQRLADIKPPSLCSAPQLLEQDINL